MKKKLLKYLCCPINHDKLHIEEQITNEEKEEFLCSSLGLRYSINNGIPDLRTKVSFPVYFSKILNSTNNKRAYVDVLEKIGFSGSDISKMDALRDAINKKSYSYISKYLNGVVLEIGAGTNYLKNAFENRCNDWISLDYNIISTSIDVQADGQQLPFKDNIANLIICIDVLEHVPHPDKMISELQRVLKKDGVLILSTPFFFYLHGSPFDFYRFSKYGLSIILEENGFKVNEIQPIAGAISTFGILLTIFIVKVFNFSKYLLKILLIINKFMQKIIIVPLDKIIDKEKRFAQGHIVIAKKNKI